MSALQTLTELHKKRRTGFIILASREYERRMAITPFHARYRGRSATNLAYSLLCRVENGSVTNKDRAYVVVAKQLQPSAGVVKMRRWLGYI